MKKLPYDKTFVIEAVVTLADALSRSRALKASASAVIPTTSPTNSGDAIVTEQNPLIVHPAHLFVVSSMENFRVQISDTGSTVVTECQGLFIHNGPLTEVRILPAAGEASARVQFVWA